MGNIINPNTGMDMPTFVTPKIMFQALRPGAVLPQIAHETDAGYDLSACFDAESLRNLNVNNTEMADYVEHSNVIKLGNWQRVVVPTGLRVQLPPPFYANLGAIPVKTSLPPILTCRAVWELEIVPRSGLAAKFGITILNSPGTIDHGYRGEIGVILRNSSHMDFYIKCGDRIAQAKFHVVYQPTITMVDEIDINTDRSTGGFGHTGVSNGQ